MAKKFVFEVRAGLPDDDMDAAEVKVALKPAMKAFTDALDAAGILYDSTTKTVTERKTPSAPRKPSVAAAA